MAFLFAALSPAAIVCPAHLAIVCLAMLFLCLMVGSLAINVGLALFLLWSCCCRTKRREEVLLREMPDLFMYVGSEVSWPQSYLLSSLFLCL